MIVYWGLFLVSVFFTYVGISVFAHLSGGSASTPFSAAVSALRPIPLIIVTLANVVFALGLYYGFKATRFAIPTALAMGVIVSFIYSVALLGATVTLSKIVGIVTIIIGIVILSL